MKYHFVLSTHRWSRVKNTVTLPKKQYSKNYPIGKRFGNKIEDAAAHFVYVVSNSKTRNILAEAAVLVETDFIKTKSGLLSIPYTQLRVHINFVHAEMEHLLFTGVVATGEGIEYGYVLIPCHLDQRRQRSLRTRLRYYALPNPVRDSHIEWYCVPAKDFKRLCNTSQHLA